MLHLPVFPSANASLQTLLQQIDDIILLDSIVISAVIIGVGLLVGVEVPVLVAAVFGVLISLPLSLVLFKSLRIRVNESIAGVDEERRRARADLQAKLRGEDEK